MSSKDYMISDNHLLELDLSKGLGEIDAMQADAMTLVTREHFLKLIHQQVLVRNTQWTVQGGESLRVILEGGVSGDWLLMPFDLLSPAARRQYEFSQLSFWLINHLLRLDILGLLPLPVELKTLKEDLSPGDDLIQRGTSKQGVISSLGWRMPSWKTVWPEVDLIAFLERHPQHLSKVRQDQFMTQFNHLGLLIDAIFSLDSHSLVKLLYMQNPYVFFCADLVGHDMNSLAVQVWEAIGFRSFACNKSGDSNASSTTFSTGSAPFLSTKSSGMRYKRILSHMRLRMRPGIDSKGCAQPITSKYPELFKGLNVQQTQALQASLGVKLFVLTGGPGSGKTFTLSRIVQLRRLESATPIKIALCAPTGKARERMAEMALDSDCDLFTLHRILKVQQSLALQPSAIMPLPYHLVIVDEASMINYELFDALLNALDPETTLILVGDPNQLPPVDGRAPFHCIVEAFHSHHSSMVQLEKSHRVGSLEMLNFAEALLQGDQKNVMRALDEAKQGKDFKFLDLDAVYSMIKDEYLDLFQAQSTLDNAITALSKFRILASHNTGRYGVQAVNNCILTEILSKARKEFRKNSQNCSIYLPILITRNQEDLGLVNGQLVIAELKSADITPYLQRLITQVGDNKNAIMRALQSVSIFTTSVQRRELFLGQVEQWDFGFALTIHKSQGSEYEHAVLLLPQGAEAWGSPLLYTGFTRAKKKLCLFTDKKIVESIFLQDDILQKTSKKLCHQKRNLLQRQGLKEIGDLSVDLEND